MRVGLLGTGSIAAQSADALRSSRDCEPVAVASRELARAESFAERHGVAVSHGSLVADSSVAAAGRLLPHVTEPDRELREQHVLEDVMQLVDWIRDGTASIATAEHSHHVIDIIDAAYRAATTGATQRLTTTVDGMVAG